MLARGNVRHQSVPTSVLHGGLHGGRSTADRQQIALGDLVPLEKSSSISGRGCLQTTDGGAHHLHVVIDARHVDAQTQRSLLEATHTATQIQHMVTRLGNQQEDDLTHGVGGLACVDGLVRSSLADLGGDLLDQDDTVLQVVCLAAVLVHHAVHVHTDGKLQTIQSPKFFMNHDACV